MDSSHFSTHRPDAISISLANEQTAHPVDEARLVAAVEAVMRDSPFTTASISIAIVDDATMHELNRRYLKHDYPTDVLSFVLENDEKHLEGEIIASIDTAAEVAGDLGLPPDNELLLYVIHGALHLVGYRDKSPDDIAAMRAAELRYLRQFDSAISDIRGNGAIEHGDSAR
jgi:probable rRNA maturation factor